MIPIGGPYGRVIVKIVYRLLTGPRLYDGARLCYLVIRIDQIVLRMGYLIGLRCLILTPQPPVFFPGRPDPLPLNKFLLFLKSDFSSPCPPP